MKKKILVVVENFRIGGVQKSLVNLLNNVADLYDIDVAAFDPIGEYHEIITGDVRIINMPRHYCTFARPRGELKNKILWIYKLAFFYLAKIFNKGIALNIVSPLYRLKDQYDIAISYNHSGYYKGVNGICPEFIIKKANAQKKICFIHCDYDNSGLKSEYNNKLYAKFDRIACCSDSVRKVFLHSNPLLDKRTFTVRNFYDLELSHVNRVDLRLPEEKINVFSVARLSKEKGIIRAVEALHRSKRKDINYYIIGDGSQKDDISRLIIEYNMTDQVFLMGPIANPYPQLLNSDYLLVPSLNEAAPMVFDEAKMLGVSVISTNTTSAVEMLGRNDIICDNSIEGICDAFISLHKPMIEEKKYIQENNAMQTEQLRKLLDTI